MLALVMANSERLSSLGLSQYLVVHLRLVGFNTDSILHPEGGQLYPEVVLKVRRESVEGILVEF